MTEDNTPSHQPAQAAHPASSAPATPGDGAAPVKRSKRGFASMDKDAVKRIASLGGQAAHRSGNAHQFTTEEARQAGLKSRIGRQKG